MGLTPRNNFLTGRLFSNVVTICVCWYIKLAERPSLGAQIRARRQVQFFNACWARLS